MTNDPDNDAVAVAGLSPEMLDALDCGVSVFDADLVLVTCNRRYRELLDFPAYLCEPGVTLESTLRFNAERGDYGPGDVEAIVREKMERARSPISHRFDRYRPGGALLEVVGRPMPGGGFVTTYIDRSLDRDRTKSGALTDDVLVRALEHTSDGFRIWDDDDRLAYANARVRDTQEALGLPLQMGATFEEITRRRVEKLGVPAGFPDAESYVSWRLQSHLTGDRAFVIEHPRGTWTLLHDHVLPDGKRMTASTDVTDLKRAEIKASESEGRLRDFADASSDRFWETDRNHRFSKMAETAETSNAPRTQDLIGKTRWSHVNADPENDPKWREHRETLDRHEPFRDFQYDIGMPNGETRHWRTSGVPVFDADGAFIGYRGIAADETDTRRASIAARQALETALSKAEIASRAKSLFLAMVSHELRTPLNAIIGFSDLLLLTMGDTSANRRPADRVPSASITATDDNKHIGYIENIRNSGQQLHHLIEDVLNMTRVEMGDIEPRQTRVDLFGEVRTAIESAGIRLQQSIDRIEMTFPETPVSLWGDARMIRQITFNLVSNALKFSDASSKIAVTGTVDETGAVLSIEDRGIGIEPDALEMVLRPFEQADSRLSRTHEGLGLGLPIATAFVELLGGGFTIDSEPGRGTRIEIRFGPDRITTLTPPA
jgi:two-component system cell cycle sensor histidine kinase PleC